MARQSRKANGSENGSSNGESTQAYFKRVLAENPRLLKGRSNDKIFELWLADHPGHTEVPKNIRANLSNVKSSLRSKGRKGRKRAEAPALVGAPQITGQRRGKPNLVGLEEAIDDCMTLAKNLSRTELDSIIEHLRRARNEVVVRMAK